MFENLFTYPAVLSRHINAPFAQEREQYLTHRARDGTAKETLLRIARELLVIVEEMDLSGNNKITDRDIKLAAKRWASKQIQRNRAHGAKHPQILFIQVARDWLGFIGQLKTKKVRPSPPCPMVEDFASYMKNERGLSEATIFTRSWYIKLFIKWLTTQKCTINNVSVADIDKFITRQQCKQNWSRVTCAHCTSSLRTFFRHAERRNWCANGIADAIESPRIFKQEALPVGPAWEDVQKLLGSTETNVPVDIRDRAILILLAIYGFRSNEVIHLTLDDLDWEQEIINIYRSKSRITQTYPLIHSAGEAVLEYLKKVRPKAQCRNIFLTVRAPFQPISSSSIYRIVNKRMLKLGIEAVHKGPHSLRHACAAHLVSEGFSLKEIGDHLGHRSAFATRTYAKVDINGLREVADFDIGGLL